MTILSRFSNPLRSEKTPAIRCNKLAENIGTVRHLMKDRCFQPKPHHLPTKPFRPFRKHTKPHTNSSPAPHKPSWNKITSFIRVQRFHTNNDTNNNTHNSSVSQKSSPTTEIVSFPQSDHQTPQKQTQNQLDLDLVSLIPSPSPDRKQRELISQETPPKSQSTTKLSLSDHYFISSDQEDQIIQLEKKQMKRHDSHLSTSSFPTIKPREKSFSPASFSHSPCGMTPREESFVLPSPSTKRQNSFFLNLLAKDNTPDDTKSVTKSDDFNTISYETTDSSSQSSASTSAEQLPLEEQNQIFKMAPPLIIISLRQKEKKNNSNTSSSRYSFRKEKKSRPKFGIKSTVVYITMYLACFLFYSLIFFVRRFS